MPPNARQLLTQSGAQLALHEACGFTEVGTLVEVGHKLAQWIDVKGTSGCW